MAIPNSDFVKSTKALKVHSDSVDGIVWIKGSVFVTGSHDGSLKMIDVNKPKGLEVLGVMNGHKDAIYSVATTVDHSKIVSSSDGSTNNLLVWDSNTLKVSRKLETSNEPVFHVSICPVPFSFNPPGTKSSNKKDRTLVLSGSRDGKIRIHDIDEEIPLATFQLQSEKFLAVTHTAFCPELSPSKNLLASISCSDGSLHVIQIAEQGISVGRVEGLHGGESVLSSRFIITKQNAAPRLLTSGKDGLIKLFDLGEVFKAVKRPDGTSAGVAQPSAVFKPEGAQSAVRGTRMNAGGDKFVSFSSNGDIKLWALDPLLDAKIRVDRLSSQLTAYQQEVKVHQERTLNKTAPANTPLLLEQLNSKIEITTKDLNKAQQKILAVKAHAAQNEKTPLTVNPLNELLGHTQVASGAVWAPISTDGSTDGTIVTCSWDSTIKVFPINNQ